ncbi:MAG TPA: flagellar basal body rod protein FlgB [Blastocatellia bacterium]|nr:flagellar basal body rod protein FlgB [Blastocatellia bacterium]
MPGVEQSLFDLSGVDRITGLLTKFLDVQSRRAEVVAGNLANADTPGYEAQELDFAQYLQHAAREALTGTRSPGSPETLQNTLLDVPRIMTRTDTLPGIDGNTVDVGREMATLSDAGMHYLEGTTLLQARLRTLRAAIREGR